MEARTASEASEQPDPKPTPISTIAILKQYRDFRLLALATIGTHTAQWIINVALGWLMLELTNSALWVGLVGFASGVPMLLVSIPAGMLLDRYDRRRILLTCQLVMLVLALSLTVLMFVGVLGPWGLLAGSFINGALMSANNSARQTLIPSTVPREILATSVGLTASAQHVSRIAGPSIAGILIGAFTATGAFVFQAAMLVIASIVTFSMRISVEEVQTGAGAGRLFSGIQYLRENRLVRDLILLAGIPMLFVIPYLQLLPVISRDILGAGPSGLGILMACSGVGAVSGGLLAGRATRIERTGLFVIVAAIGYGGVALGIAGSTSFYLTAAFVCLGSLTGATFQSVTNTILFMVIDDSYRGRVTGIYMLTFGLYPIGGLPMGFLADQTSVPTAIVTGAAISSTLAALLAIRAREMRQVSIA